MQVEPQNRAGREDVREGKAAQPLMVWLDCDLSSLSTINHQLSTFVLFFVPFAP